MPKILCIRPNASDEISGVKFTPVEEGMLSEDISDDTAAAFLEIDGYKLVPGKKSGPSQAEMDAERAEADALAKLAAEAEAAGMKVDSRWKLETLTKRYDEFKAAKPAA